MDANFVRTALLSKNYYPHHRTLSAEMPPFFTTESLSVSCAQKLASTKPRPSSKKGYDFVPYTLTRFNGGPRLFGIPHPHAYCKIVEEVFNNWLKILPIIETNSSQIKAKKHKDGRIFVMDYEDQFCRSKSYLNKQACATFIAKTDISNFYPSIYTHAIGWSAVGIEAAKASNGNTWFNKLDLHLRNCKRQETNGILIGSGVSSLFSEFLLSPIDRYLQNKGYKFQRFIDDYTCFAKSRGEAESFLSDLERQLSKFSLFLNFRKTGVEPHTGIELPKWIADLDASSISENSSFFSLKIYLSRAIEISHQYPEASVLRYAINAISDKNFSNTTGEYILRVLLSLSLRNHHLIGSIDHFLKYGFDGDDFKYVAEIGALCEKAVYSRRSDAMCWSLHLLKKVGQFASSPYSHNVLKTFDPCSLVMLYECGDSATRRSITRYVKKSILPRDDYAIQRNWILVHYLLNIGTLKSSEVNDDSLRLLRKEKVSLFKRY